MLYTRYTREDGGGGRLTTRISMNTTNKQFDLRRPLTSYDRMFIAALHDGVVAKLSILEYEQIKLHLCVN